MEEIPFEVDAPTGVLCTRQVCGAGHVWAPQVAVAKCEGCGSPVVAVRMVNCPWCNEEVGELALRVERVSNGIPIVPVCKGMEPKGEMWEVEVVKEDRQGKLDFGEGNEI